MTTTKFISNETLRAAYYFYPDRLWAGYARFFEPHLPSRIGYMLVSYIHDGVFYDNAEARRQAIEILSKSHTKRPNGPGIEPHDVECYPTDEATKAIILLSEISSVR